MTTLTLSTKLNETDLSGFISPSQIKSQVSSIFSDLQGEVTFNEEPTNNVLKNPTFTGAAGTYQTSGSVNYKTDKNGEIMSVSSNFNGATILTDSGKITITGTLTSNVAATGDSASSIKITRISFDGKDNSKWSFEGGYASSQSYSAKTDKALSTYSENYTSLTSTDSNKNTITFTGKINGSQDVDGNFTSTGAITNIDLSIASTNTKLNATGLALTFNDLANFQMGSVADLLPTFLSGNDVITIPKGWEDSVFGYGGNDSIIGSAGDDVIVGGVGNDTLNGGEGNDTFMMGGESIYGGYGNDSMPATVSYSDVIDGGAGNDTVILSGYSAQDRQGRYFVSGTSNDITIKDLRTNSVTKVKNVENFAFDDGTIQTSTDFLISPTATNLNGSNLLSNIGTVDSNNGPTFYWDYTIGDYINFDPSLTKIIANYASENWVAASKGSNSYDPDLPTLQTIKLKSAENSSLTFTQQNDDKVRASSYDFVSSDKKVTFKSVYSNTDSDTTGSSTHQITYTNTGESGTEDDIKATQSKTSTETKSLKNGIWTANETGNYALNYVGGDYKIDIATTKNEKSSYSDYNQNDYTSSSLKITTISKYNFSNAETGFNLTLAGTSTKDSNYSAVNYSQSEKIALSNVTLTSSDFKLTATNVSYVEDQDVMYPWPHGITNINSYPAVSAEAMQEDLMTYVVPNVMNGDNTITITNTEGAVIDAGSGKDSVVGNIGDDTIVGGAGNDTLNGGAGNDTFMIGGESIDGGYGNDSIPATVSYNDVIDGGEGNDTVTLFDYSTTQREGIYSVSGTPKDVFIKDLLTKSITQIKNVETFSFSDGELTAEDLFKAPTAIKLTGSDLLGEGNNNLPNISDDLYELNNYWDPSFKASLGNYVNEKWAAKTPGSNSYDPQSTALQSIALKSDEGSNLSLAKQMNMATNGYLSSNDYNFLSSDKKITLSSSSKSSGSFTGESLTGASGNDYISSISYTNLGEDGLADDINVSIKHSSTSKYDAKKMSGDSSGTDLITYSGGGYKIDIQSSDIGKSSNLAWDNTTNISKYNFSSTLTGFNISFSGVLKHNYARIDSGNNESENISLTKVALTTADYKLGAAKVSYDDPNLHGLTNLSYVMVPVDAMQEDLMNYLVPNILNSDNTIRITKPEGAVIDAGSGKDIIVGNIGDDTIVGGAGSDRLIGGKGADTFLFNKADFFTANINGDLVFNKSVDTITDFYLKDHDKLDFGDLGQLSFYDKLADAKEVSSPLFYVKSSGSIYLNTSTINGFTPTVIITLTGKPVVNSDLTDFNYSI